ncbi:MAG: carbohydrate binding domain-containing protein [Muribaculaceae bacterium]|nr:carbohydrate binding domain-containing protein [Muribaculaceae bacterium]
MKPKAIASFILLSTFALSLHANIHTFDIDASAPGVPVPPTLYGVFFEDINFAADGGLYAEQIKNRSFEFPQHLMGWQTFGNVELHDDGPFERNPHYVRLTPPDHHAKLTGLTNEGFFGIGLERDSTYRFSVWARTLTGNHTAHLRVELVDPASAKDTQVLASSRLIIDSPVWKRYETTLKPDDTCPTARLRVILDSRDCTLDLEHLSLFPAATWRNQENELRADLAQMLFDLRPGVLRFPGGCIVEGTDTHTRYKWKESVGPVENRPTNENRWRDCFDFRLYPDYYQSYGLGFYEFFRLAEDLGAEPVPVVSVGLACQFQNQPAEQPSVESLDEYISDALDLIEFANGPAESTWGAVRARMGHSEPFNMKYLGLGNEQWGSEYIERLETFITRLRYEHPEIRIIGSSGPYSSGPDFDYLWPEMRRLNVDLVDEHNYSDKDFFLSQANRFDSYDRNGPKIFAGEYACHPKGKKYNHFEAALCESAFMTGLERNADIVEMATYAPLLAHVDGWQWRPDMIWFDNLRAMPTSSYHVQKLFSNNRGTHVLPLTMNGQPVAGQDSLYASAVADKNNNSIIVKVVNTASGSKELHINLAGLEKAPVGGRIITLTSGDLDAENTLDNPNILTPVETPLQPIIDTRYTGSVPPHSLSVLIFEQ